MTAGLITYLTDSDRPKQWARLDSGDVVQAFVSIDSSGLPAAGGTSTVNSTAVALEAGATFTGTGELNDAADVLVTCKTDAAGTLYVDFSVDGGVTYDSQIPFQIAAGVGEFHAVVKGPRTCRIRVVNGAAPQTYMRLSTMYGTFRQPNSALNSSVQQDADASTVRTVDAFLAMQQGLFQGYSIDTKFGRNTAVTAAEDIWEGGGDYTGQPASGSPELVTVVSSATTDASGNTGARTVRIYGLKTSTSTAYESEDIILAGTTPVDSVNTWYRMNRAVVLTAGTAGGNAGTITIAHKTTTANVFCVMQIGLNQTTIAAYTVPAGATMYIKSVSIYGSRANSTAYADIMLRVRPPGGVFAARRIYQVGTGIGVDTIYPGAVVVEAGSDVKIRAETVSAGTLNITAEFSYILVQT